MPCGAQSRRPAGSFSLAGSSRTSTTGLASARGSAPSGKAVMKLPAGEAGAGGAVAAGQPAPLLVDEPPAASPWRLVLGRGPERADRNRKRGEQRGRGGAP